MGSCDPERVHRTLLQMSMVGSLTPRSQITITITMSIIIIMIISGATPLNNNVSVYEITIPEIIFFMLAIVDIIIHIVIPHKNT